jgi:hypothetical protein
MALDTRKVEWFVVCAIWLYGGDPGRNLFGSMLALLALRMFWRVK